MTGLAPLVRLVSRVVPSTAAGATAGTPAARAPFAGHVAAVRYVPAGAITGANTNTRRVSLINRGQNGAGATVVATLQFDAGVNAAAFDDVAVPVTEANRAVAAGDILEWRSAAVGTGMADPGGMVELELARE